MKYIINKKGFTLVETLVAIAILMISIVGPLTIAQKSLSASIYARDQVVASFLAQDSMESIKNDRNNLPTDEFLSNIDSCTNCIAAGSFSNKYTRNISHSIINRSNNDNNEVIVKVTISWNTGTINNSFTLEDHLFKDVIL